ncbi:MAG TPA: nickel pincer cofactor biosynthesis protein LarC [Vicinamibacterales bacterium]
MKVLYFDCFAGAAGDMILGALIDAGVKLEDVRRALGSLAISPSTVWTERVIRTGIAATKFCVKGEHGPLDHAHDDSRGHDDHSRDHEHDHGLHHQGHRHVHTEPHEEKHHHVHRTLDDINRLIDGSALSQPGKDRAKELFARLGEAEAAIHGTSLAQVHLHEVGALDSIIDIVGTVFAMETLGAERIVASPLNVGGGTVRTAHGVYPVPAPATVRLLRGAPIYAGAQKAEMVTPTGALLIAGYAQEFGPVPPMRVAQIGYGAGNRDFADTPNVVRVLIGEADAAAASHTVVVIEAEIDDMNPQIFGVLMDRLLAQGALDVFYTPIQMKKNRPGILLSVIAAPDKREAFTGTIFRETTTIGLRYREMTRECLDRRTVTVTTSVGDVRIKLAARNGHIFNAAPEFEDCVRLAGEHNLPAKTVQALAMKAWLDAGNRES